MSAPTAAVTEAHFYTCLNCGGSGECPQYRHIDDGICFTCEGTGRVNFEPKPIATRKRDPNVIQKALTPAQREIVFAAYGQPGMDACGETHCDAFIVARRLPDCVNYTLDIGIIDVYQINDEDTDLRRIGGGAIYFRGKRGAWTDVEVSDSLRRRISPRQAVALLDAIAR